jgi:L-fucose isomerase-like protein
MEMKNMKRNELEEISFKMVNSIINDNNVNKILKKEEKDLLYSVCNQSIILGYQMAYQELLLTSEKNLREIGGIFKNANKIKN